MSDFEKIDVIHRGAEALLEALALKGVEVCFANPGTSEMHLVTAIGDSDSIRPILCLFEGVVTGAADGYWRMKGKPAVNLLHLGPGYANGMANMHNAKRAFSGMVNIVGDHATWHLEHDAPLTSDIEGHVHLHSDWVCRSTSANHLWSAGLAAVEKSHFGWGKISTIIAPANHAWELTEKLDKKFDGEENKNLLNIVSDAVVERATQFVQLKEEVVLILGGRALREDCLILAGQLARKFNIKLLCETFSARIERGEGRVAIERIPYFAEHAIEFLSKYKKAVLIGAKDPVGFFAYPNVSSRLLPEDCEILQFAGVDDDIENGLKRLVGSFANLCAPILQQTEVVHADGEVLSPANLSAIISSEIPEDTILSDEGITCSAELYEKTKGAPKHDWLSITGGSIGQGLPVSFGASIACPDRKVVAFQADGSAMYTVQALWSIVRENCDLTIVIINNKSYAILNIELQRLEAGTPSDKATSMLNMTPPAIDWVSLAKGLGMKASRASSASEFKSQFRSAMTSTGPCLIEAVVVQDVLSTFKK